MNRPILQPLSSSAVIVAATLTLASPAAWAAKPSSFAESRGYHMCVDAAGQETRIVKVETTYFIYDHGEARRYYLNGYGFRDGESSPVKIACDTTPSGTRLLDISVDAGHYAGRFAEPADVARN